MTIKHKVGREVKCLGMQMGVCRLWEGSVTVNF